MTWVRKVVAVAIALTLVACDSSRDDAPEPPFQVEPSDVDTSDVTRIELDATRPREQRSTSWIPMLGVHLAVVAAGVTAFVLHRRRRYRAVYEHPYTNPEEP